MLVSYIRRPIRQSIEDFQALGFKDQVLDKLLYGNAARLSGLGGVALNRRPPYEGVSEKS